MQGKIIKGIAGFYYVHVAGMGTYECKAKGVFRNKKIKPAVGDNVEIDVIDEAGKKGNISSVLERKNELIRPTVANIDQILLIFALKNPEPNLGLLDRFIVTMDMRGIDTIIAFSKCDLASQEEIQRLKDIYSDCGKEVLFISTKMGIGTDRIEEIIEGKTTAMAGPSGVGKSTLMNLIKPSAEMEVGSVSEKIGRGKHTTRHSEIFHIKDDSYFVDTPGFTSLMIEGLEAEELHFYFHEFEQYEGQCRFNGCMHINEPECAVKEALKNNKINLIRYESYKNIYDELKSQRRY